MAYGARIALLTSALVVAALAQGVPAAPVVLQPGAAVTRELRPETPVPFRLEASAGDFIRIDIDPMDIALTFAVRSDNESAPAFKELLRGEYGPHRIAFIAGATGSFDVSVEPFENAAGTFRILVADRRTRTPMDEQWIAAQTRQYSAITAQRAGTAQALRNAADDLQEAATLWRGLGDQRGEAMSLSRLGILQINLGQLKEAGITLGQARDLWQQLGDLRAEGETVSFLGDTLAPASPDLAARTFETALEIRRRARDRRGEATTLYQIASLSVRTGDALKAAELFESVLKTRHELGDRTGETAALANLAITRAVLGENREAAKSLEAALSIAPGQNPRLDEQLEVNLGKVYLALGEYQTSITKCLQALKAAKSLGDIPSQAAVLNNLGIAFQQLGNFPEALRYYNESLELKRTSNDKRGEGATLNNLAFLKNLQHRYQDALRDIDAALPLSHEARDLLNEASLLNSKADALEGMGLFADSETSYRQALAIRQTIHDRYGESYSWLGLGRINLSLKRLSDAEHAYLKAVESATAVEDRHGEALALSGLARTDVAQKRLDGALIHIEEAFQIVEGARSQLVLPGQRTSFFSLYQDDYDFATNVLMQLEDAHPRKGYAEKALAMNERRQARTLAELLRESGAAIRQGAPPELTRRERDLGELLSAKIDMRLRLDPSSVKAATLGREIQRLTAEHDQADAALRSASPRYRALVEPASLNARQMQHLLADQKTVIVEFAVGPQRSYGWLITRSAIKWFRLPSKSEIEAVARSFYEAVSSRTSMASDHEQSGRKLGAMLLGPVAREIAEKTLIIVPSGILCYIPFDALDEPGVSSAPYTPLVVNHSVFTLPSASILPLLRESRRLQKTVPGNLGSLIAVFADPVVDSGDSRLDSSARISAVVSRGIGEEADISDERSEDRSMPAGVFGRLVYSRDEAAAIQAVFPPPKTRLFLDFDANLSLLRSSTTSQNGILHIATHGVLDAEFPERSGLVFSMYDAAGKPRQGLLRMGAVFDLNIPSELVVLSACRTALGGDVKGEGLIGLTRAFMYAGASRVIASLWNVDDAATADLMGAFYRNLAAGQGPGEALRAAKRKLLENPVRSRPYYWAAFVSAGEFDDRRFTGVRE